jgi:hypothetical protein
LWGAGNKIFSIFWGKIDGLGFEKKYWYGYACMMSSRSSLTRSSISNVIKKSKKTDIESNLWIARFCHLIGEANLSRLFYAQSRKLLGSPLESKVADLLKEFNIKLNDQSLCKEIDLLVGQLNLLDSLELPIVYTVVSADFLDLFDFWNSRVDSFLPCEKVILVLDSKSKFHLQKYPNIKVIDFSFYFCFDEKSKLPKLIKANLWILRVGILKSLLRFNRKIYCLDLDAILMNKNLPQLLDSFPDHDVVGQIDYSIPLDVASDLGFVVCCGVMVLNSNKKVKYFLEKLFKRVQLELDDQIALNHLLNEQGLKKIKRNEKYLSFESDGLSWILPSRYLISRSLDFGECIRHHQDARNLNSCAKS